MDFLVNQRGLAFSWLAVSWFEPTGVHPFLPFFPSFPVRPAFGHGPWIRILIFTSLAAFPFFSYKLLSTLPLPSHRSLPFLPLFHLKERPCRGVYYMIWPKSAFFVPRTPSPFNLFQYRAPFSTLCPLDLCDPGVCPASGVCEDW